ncbi:DUF2155 domain-containing protein [Phenylobacterium sp.]|uniref:DUF2155 domain-containing protein n=1 Tax=Phenylobacterium sp. TaxID=1871053 RepID=UPI002F91D08A
MRVASVRWLKRSAWVSALGAAALSGLVSAQPAPPLAPPDEPAPGPTAPVAEEAPPINVPPPAPIVAPPLTEKEVAPAPPKEEAAKPPEAPLRRARYDVAILQALDKVTAESLRFEAAVGRPVRYKNLVFTVRACERSTPEEAVEDAIAYLTIESQPRPQPGRSTPAARQAFKGWMYAASPGLHPMEHPVYDAWLINCRASAPVTPVVARTVPAAPAPKAAPPAKAPPAKAAPSVAAAPAPKAAPPVATPPPKAVPPAAEPAPAAPEPKA